MNNQIDIMPGVYAAETQALADFFQNRTLVSAQKLYDVSVAFQASSDREKALYAQIDALEQARSYEHANRALAELLRTFVSEEKLTPSIVKRLVIDAKRVISQGEIIDDDRRGGGEN